MINNFSANNISYKKIAIDVSKKYHNISNLVGIIWIGSSSHGVYDELADIDIQLVCSKNDNKFSMEQLKKENIKIEVSKTTTEWLLQKTDPDAEQFWIRETAKILYDPHNVLEKKFRTLNKVNGQTYKKILWRLYKDIFHSYDFEKSIKRKEEITAWMFIFKTIDSLSKFCFIYDQKPVPAFKWRWYFISKEGLIDKKIVEKIKLFDSKNSGQNFNLLKDIETQAQKMMLKKGYPENFVSEPWLF